MEIEKDGKKCYEKFEHAHVQAVWNVVSSWKYGNSFREVFMNISKKKKYLSEFMHELYEEVIEQNGNGDVLMKYVATDGGRFVHIEKIFELLMAADYAFKRDLITY